MSKAKSVVVSRPRHLIPFEIIELQGKLETNPTSELPLNGHFLGHLKRAHPRETPHGRTSTGLRSPSKASSVKRHELIIERKKLLGKTVDLLPHRKLVVLQKRPRDPNAPESQPASYRLLSIVDKKLIFRRRPTPWERAATASRQSNASASQSQYRDSGSGPSTFQPRPLSAIRVGPTPTPTAFPGPGVGIFPPLYAGSQLSDGSQSVMTPLPQDEFPMPLAPDLFPLPMRRQSGGGGAGGAAIVSKSTVEPKEEDQVARAGLVSQQTESQKKEEEARERQRRRKKYGVFSSWVKKERS